MGERIYKYLKDYLYIFFKNFYWGNDWDNMEILGQYRNSGIFFSNTYRKL